MLQIHRELQEGRKARAKRVGLNEEVLASYEAVAGHHNGVYGVDILRDLIHDVVQKVKRVLRKRDVRAEDFETLIQRIMEQAGGVVRGLAGGGLSVFSAPRTRLSCCRDPRRGGRAVRETAARAEGGDWRGGVAVVYGTTSRPFDPPATGKIAITVINHYGDEVLKVFSV